MGYGDPHCPFSPMLAVLHLLVLIFIASICGDVSQLVDEAHPARAVVLLADRDRRERDLVDRKVGRVDQDDGRIFGPV